MPKIVRSSHNIIWLGLIHIRGIASVLNLDPVLLSATAVGRSRCLKTSPPEFACVKKCFGWALSHLQFLAPIDSLIWLPAKCKISSES